MTRLFTGACLWLMVLTHATPLSAVENTAWVNVTVGTSLAGEEIRTIGRSRFPDGIRTMWVGTPAGLWRKIDDDWERWPDDDTVNREVRDILLAPDASGITHWWLATSDGLLLTPDEAVWRHLNTGNSSLTNDDIHALHLSQEDDGTPVIWVGTSQGLLQLRDEESSAVVARSGGFHGGQINHLLGIEARSGRQVWAAGRQGLSVYTNGQWRRPDRNCHHRQAVHDIRVVNHPLGNRVGIATDQGLILIDPDNFAECRQVDTLHADDQPVIALTGSGDDGLMLLGPDGIERLQFARSGEISRWSWFDHRDGLPAPGDWIAGQAPVGHNELLVAAKQGLWRWNTGQHEMSAPGDTDLSLLLEGPDEQVKAGDSIAIGDSMVRLAVQPANLARPHAALYRLSVDNGESWMEWQRSRGFEVELRQFGWHSLKVEMIDDRGERRGPWQFHLEKAFPIGLVSTLLLATLAVIVIMLVLARVRRNGRRAS